MLLGTFKCIWDYLGLSSLFLLLPYSQKSTEILLLLCGTVSKKSWHDSLGGMIRFGEPVHSCHDSVLFWHHWWLGLWHFQQGKKMNSRQWKITSLFFSTGVLQCQKKQYWSKQEIIWLWIKQPFLHMHALVWPNNIAQMSLRLLPTFKDGMI